MKTSKRLWALALLVLLVGCEVGETVVRLDDPESSEIVRDRWLAVLGDKALARYQEANGWLERPAVVVKTASGLEEYAPGLTSVPGAVDSAHRPQLVEMAPDALAALNAAHVAGWKRFPAAELFTDSTALAVFLQLTTGVEDMAEIRARVKGEPYPVKYLRAVSRPWVLTLNAIEANERDYKAVVFKVESRFYIERNMPPSRRGRVGLSNLRVEAFWDGEAWVVSEPTQPERPDPETRPNMECERTGPHTVRNCEEVTK